MARPREFDEERVLDAAMRVFWKKGYPGTSLQDLVDATGLERPSIYNAYGNKRGIFCRVFDLYASNYLSHTRDLLEKAPTAGEAIDALLRNLIKQQFRSEMPHGCLAGLAASECEMHDPNTQSRVSRLYREVGDLIYERLLAGRESGEFADDFDARSTSSALVGVMTGMVTLRRADFSRHTFHQMRRAALKMLD